MKRYIKIDGNNDIIDLFCDYQTIKFDGTEIEFDDISPPSHKINGKSLSNEDGTPIFYWNGSKAIDKPQGDIDTDPKTIAGNKERIRGQIKIPELAMLKLIDDILDNIVNGTPIPQPVINKMIERNNLRGQL